MALAPFADNADNAGSASALLGFIQMGIGGLLSSAVGLIKIKGSFPASLLILITSVIAAVILLATAGRVRNTVEAEADANVFH